jgi:hypothetical protein
MHTGPSRAILKTLRTCVLQASSTGRRGASGSRRLCERPASLQCSGMHTTSSTLRPDELQPTAVLRLVVLAKYRPLCAPSDGRFLVERGDLMLIEEQPAAGKGQRRDLRPLSFQESLELLVNAPHECCHMTRTGTVANRGYAVELSIPWLQSSSSRRA